MKKYDLKQVLRTDPGSGAFLTPGSGMGKILIKIRIRDEHPGFELRNNFFRLKKLKFFDADPGSEIFLTLDPGWKNSDPG